MKYLFLFIYIVGFTISTFAQKPPIDSSAIKKWPQLGYCAISNDGNFVMYNIKNQPVGSNTTVIQSTNDSWKKDFIGNSYGFFSGDSKQFILFASDTLYFFRLGTDSLDKVPNIGSYKWSGKNRSKWLAYQLKHSPKDLFLRNLYTGKEQSFKFVTDYLFDNSGNVLLLKTDENHNNISTNAIHWINLAEGKMKTIWSKESDTSNRPLIGNFCFDENGSQLTFIVEQKNDVKSINTIWYFKSSTDKAILQVNDQSRGIDLGFSIGNGSLQFSKNGNWIYFQLQQDLINQQSNKTLVKVDVWTYKDLMLQPEQLKELKPKKYIAAIHSKGGAVIRITKENEDIARAGISDYIIINDNKCRNDFWWNNPVNSYYLFSLRDSSRKLLAKGGNYGFIFSFSPRGRYIIYFDRKLKCYFSYDILMGKNRNISQAIPTRLDNEYSYNLPGSSIEMGIAGWLDGDTNLLIYDNYDIWQVDPSGNDKPINVTNYYGKLHHIKFRLAYGSGIFDDPSDKIFQKKEPLLLTAFNVVNKCNGFYWKVLDEKEDPKLQTMGPYIFQIDKGSQTSNNTPNDAGMRPVKARDVNVWIVKRIASSEAPNYYLTKDFKTYAVLTNLQPQKEYNWLTTELVKWKQFDGEVSQGILYKPENFDPQKKYPLIFEYYEQLSFDLNAYIQPDFTQASINIPWFVSRGYLVFTPDFHFSIANLSGKTNGMHAYNAVVSAAQYLSKMKWVDGSRMAINGHSFGGGVTNYLITQTDLFAVAAEGAGGSDPISSYLDVSNRLYVNERGQGRMGATLWQRPDLYIKASAVLKANLVNTPLLIMHNKADIAVPWGQGIEMFLALRRLGKKVWMLQYDEGDHILFGKDAEDYTIRLTQFFDHYLKGAPPPKWMTEGVDASRKGIDTGLELDTSVAIP